MGLTAGGSAGTFLQQIVTYGDCRLEAPQESLENCAPDHLVTHTHQLARMLRLADGQLCRSIINCSS
jgi:hypothetical protein